MLLDGGDVILIGGVHEIVEVDHSPGGLSPPSFVLDNRFCMHISITVARKLDSAAGCEVARLGAPELEITPAIVAGERVLLSLSGRFLSFFGRCRTRQLRY